MKRILSLLASFVLGFAFFVGGAAIAINGSGTSSSEQIAEDQPSSSEEQTSPSEEPNASGSSATGSSSSGDTYCFNIGKDNELEGDCFCVQDELSDVAELDCLIASGLLPASSRDAYLEGFSSRGSGSTDSATNSNTGSGTSEDVYCFNIGKDNELEGDCFCVQDELSDVAELDCLIASGVLPASSRDAYLEGFSSRGSGSTDSATNSNTGSGTSEDVYCFNIGKDNELDGDCFCVQDEVSDMAEVDCLIASGIVPASSREGYIQYLRSLESTP
jgi:putative hemolysin